MSNTAWDGAHGERLAAGTRVGSFILGDLLAQGGFGAVYRATHATRGTPAAAKVLHGHLTARSVAVQRFEREIAIIGRLRHPNVVQILEHGRAADGLPYLVMELLRGVSLADHLVLAGPQRAEETLEILEPLASALEAAHALGVIHRDVKASNVFLAEEDGRRRVVLLDFGIAKLLDAGEPALTTSRDLVGTPAWMSPEQVSGRPVDARTDVYGLGVLAFRLLAGELPFLSRLFSVLQQLHLHAPPPSLAGRVPVSPALDAVVLAALSKDPAHRPATPGAFVRAFRGAMAAPATADAPRLVRRVLAVHAEIHEAQGSACEVTVDTHSVLESVVGDLAAVGLSSIVATGTSVLLSADLPADPERELCVRASIVEALLAVARALAGAAAPIRVRLACHVGALITTPRGEAVAGDVLDVAGWVPDVGDEGVFASPEALLGMGITPRATTGGGGAHLRIR